MAILSNFLPIFILYILHPVNNKKLLLRRYGFGKLLLGIFPSRDGIKVYFSIM